MTGHVIEDEPANDYGRGFTAGYRAGREAGKHAGRASRNIEVRNLREQLHQLDQQIQRMRRQIREIARDASGILSSTESQTETSGTERTTLT